ncbi:septum formation inhibitor Maf [Algibacter sp. AS12]|uniref:septum formation inhibitor Maf n=1 Tax=Algibacter sp. AS12 TaxID=3135773 RepID=UPI00398A91EB
MKNLETFKTILKVRALVLVTLCLFVLSSCKNNTTKNNEVAQSSNEAVAHTPKQEAAKLSQEFNNYWYAGEAEISSYKLEQARYGELRQGTAVLVFVTEDFLPDTQVKADNTNPNNIPVLKLNSTKNFVTGIYPYSIMQSSFYPVANNAHAIKVSISMQEWCGHVYMQLNNRSSFEITSHSYFDGEADQNFKTNKAILENELWTKLRVNPKSLPVGDLQIIPSFEYLKLYHTEVKPFVAKATLTANSYTITYPELNRTLAITFNPDFPFDILIWEETQKSGYGQNAKTLTTKATKLNTIKSAYWNKKSITDEALRTTLKL